MQLSEHQRQGFNKVGDLLIPGSGDFPPFSRLDNLSKLPRMLDYLPEEDQTGLLSLMGFFGRLPRFAIALILRLAGAYRFFPQPLSATLKKLDVGVRGIFFTLYYSEKRIHDHMLWDARIIGGQGGKNHEVGHTNPGSVSTGATGLEKT